MKKTCDTVLLNGCKSTDTHYMTIIASHLTTLRVRVRGRNFVHEGSRLALIALSLIGRVNKNESDTGEDNETTDLNAYFHVEFFTQFSTSMAFSS